MICIKYDISRFFKKGFNDSAWVTCRRWSNSLSDVFFRQSAKKGFLCPREILDWGHSTADCRTLILSTETLVFCDTVFQPFHLQTIVL
jgi:hypothetical protein